MVEGALLMSRYFRSKHPVKNIHHAKALHPQCPWCGLDNWHTTYRTNHPSGWEFYWDGPASALAAGRIAHLWVRRGRIYGGPKHKRKWGRAEPAPQRVNERKWKIVRVGRKFVNAGMNGGEGKAWRQYVACANKFHDDRTK